MVDSRRARRVEIVCVCVLLAVTGSLEAGQGADGRRPQASPGFRRGAVEVGIVAGGAPPTTLFRARRDHRLAIAAANIGRIVTNPVGGGSLAGQFEVLLEVTPLFVFDQPERTIGIAASPLYFRWNFVAPARVRPFLEVAAGVLLTDRSVPSYGATRFNFIEHGGVGVRVGIGVRRALLVGYRFQHISNGGRRLPNPGVNLNVFYAGLAVLR